MQIKELELSGFKSFVDRVKLQFKPGITAIVGPNGCGKSNIIDAIRWIMGEHNARQLRGTKMEDLIFNGSETRKPTGMAEVSLVLSNNNGNGSGNGNGNGNGRSSLGNVSEIMITRRLFRSGESEYYINKIPCRLRDVVELFLDSGVGTKSYSIMEQGKVDYILSLKPEERRILIEEAAGISKYRIRKKEALSRMESTRNNLARLKDIIAELQTQMRSLDLQVKRLKRYRALKEEIKELDLRLAARRYSELASLRDCLLQDRSQYHDRIMHLESQQHLSEAQLEECKLQQVQLQQQISQMQQIFYHSREAIQKEENTLTLHTHELNTTKNQIEKITQDIWSIDDDLRRLTADIALYQQQAESAAQTISEIESNASISTATLASSKESLQLLQMRLETALRELKNIQYQKTEVHNAVLLNERLLEDADTRAKKLLAELASCQQRLSFLSEQHAYREKEMHDLIAQREQHEKDISAFMLRREHAQMRFQESDRIVDELRSRLGTIRARYHSLKELQDSYEGFTDGVKYLMHEAEHTPSLRESILCLFTDILEIDPNYERALEAVLDNKLQTLVVSSWNQGCMILDFLHKTRHGRISWIDCSAHSTLAASPPPEGALPLASLVRVPDKYKNLIAGILHHVYLVSSLDCALSLRSHGFTHACFVTPQGDILDPAGIVTGGGTTTMSSNLLTRAREIRTLATEIEHWEQKLAAAEIEKQNAAETLRHITDAVSSLTTEKQNLDIAIVQVNANIEQLNKEILFEQNKCATIEHELKDIDTLRTRYTNERDTYSHISADLDQRESSVTATIRDLRQEESSLIRELEAIESASTELRIKLTAAHTTYENACATLKRIQSQYEHCLAKKEALYHERSCCEETIGRLEGLIRTSRNTVHELTLSAQSYEQQLESLHNQHATCSKTIEQLEETCKQVRVEKHNIESKLYELERELSNIEIHQDHLMKTIHEKYTCTIDQLPPVHENEPFDESDVRQRLELLQKRLENIGDVNPGAAREYEDLEQRYAYLCAQEQDLMQSIESLQKVILKINRITKQKFMESFHQINKNFQELFPVLFNGGKAYLQLTNENDLFETGIDIFAQPPGKKLQSLDLLSGGERALTVIAILFAIFLTKPTPFCLMDEIDAPLDDTNIGRFLTHLQHMAHQSQFIIVTHNKLSMQAADSLYGVTMEERGVSKIVSVSFN
ncbi:MAG: chromosome segregation protein SMC [Desulfobacterota bacterium]|nr:chromosome segregation protein SMC [Thermodesulfobacteriota bacterium]